MYISYKLEHFLNKPKHNHPNQEINTDTLLLFNSQTPYKFCPCFAKSPNSVDLFLIAKASIQSHCLVILSLYFLQSETFSSIFSPLSLPSVLFQFIFIIQFIIFLRVCTDKVQCFCTFCKYMCVSLGIHNRVSEPFLLGGGNT